MKLNTLFKLFMFATLGLSNVYFAARANSESSNEKTDVQVIWMTPKQSEEDASHSYLVAVLSLALEKSQTEFGPARIEFMSISLNQGLILHLLDIGDILDVVASAPTPERETSFRAARVPLLMGLLGYRMMIIKPEDQAKFAACR